MNERTIADLKRLKEIEDTKWKLYEESKKIKDNCPHHDYFSKITETLAYEYTPRAVCIVCGDEKSSLTLEEKISCFKEFFDYGDDDCSYTDEQFLKMAQDGGYNSPSPSFYNKENSCEPDKED